jgi:hypothetical protein
LSHGWEPNSGFKGTNQGNPRYLYVTTKPQNAEWFANERNCDTVLQLIVSKAYLAVDPEDGIGETIDEELAAAERNHLPANLVVFKPLPANAFKIYSPTGKQIEEEYLGKKGGVRYFQMGGSIKNPALYNKDNKGKPTEDPGVAGLSAKTRKDAAEDLEKRRGKKKRWYQKEAKSPTSYFKMGDEVLFGKYKNKKGKIVSWDEDKHGNPNVEIEQTPTKATGRKKKNKTIGLYRIWKGDIKEAVMQSINDFDQATNLWFYECLDGGELPEKILDVLERNAIQVYKRLLKCKWPSDCGQASDIWDKVFQKNGIASRQVIGYYNPNHHEPGMSQPGSTDHVWLELDNGRCVFDPTAGQFKGSISLGNYWEDDYNKMYDKPGEKDVVPIKEEKVYYHGTTVDLRPGDFILPPSETGRMSEKGRKKNLDKVFFTSDPESARIYAGRARHSFLDDDLATEPRVYEVEPIGNMEVIQSAPGTTVFMSPKAKIVRQIG